MKISFSSLVVLLFIGCIFSCKKDDFNYPKGTVGSSKIIYFPAVETKGDHTIYLKEGDSYGDSGAVAILNGADVTYTTDGTVDPNTPGIYNITYTAVNEQGYSASDWRTVVVIGDDVAGNDFSGNYARYTPDLGPDGAPNGEYAVWTKIGPGLYSVANPGGAAGFETATVTAVNYTGNEIAIPQQYSADFGGNVSTTSAEFDPPNVFAWALAAPGFGTQVRYFKK